MVLVSTFWAIPIGLLSILLYHYLWAFNKSRARIPPGPRGWPIIGEHCMCGVCGVSHLLQVASHILLDTLSSRFSGGRHSMGLYSPSP